MEPTNWSKWQTEESDRDGTEESNGMETDSTFGLELEHENCEPEDTRKWKHGFCHYYNIN